MNTERAKEEIKNTVKAYLAKDEDGNPLIPSVHQRPVLLIGPPGIGKTAIMDQGSKRMWYITCCIYYDTSYETECDGSAFY